MSQNQSEGQPPTAPIAAGRSREELRAVASKQKAVIVCVALNILFFALRLFIVFGKITLPVFVTWILTPCFLGLAVVSVVYIFMLGIKLYGTAIGILLGLLTFIPLVGLIILLIVNTKATRTLREGGFRVGFFGASLSQFEPAP